MEFSHKSVLLQECIDSLDIKPNGVYVDGTAGGAGHSREIAKHIKTGCLIAIDRDPDAIKTASERLAGFECATVVNSNFCNIKNVLCELKIDKADGILLDLGVSSFQLDNISRGFSYHGDAPLDMRMSKSGMSAADVIAASDANKLCGIFRDYGEEKFAYKIAQNIVAARENTPITTTAQLSEIISKSVPAKFKRDGNPSRKCFQALRIYVNAELDSLSDGLDNAFDCLSVGGILSIITFHSLEDRMVKRRFKEFCTGCDCPSDFPICVCGKEPRGELSFRKPIIPTAAEIAENPRSRSAKLRVIRKL